MIQKHAGILFVAMAGLLSFQVHARHGVCDSNGRPNGTLAVCAQPLSPSANTIFNLNFTGATCVLGDTRHQYTTQLTGNVYSIYYDYVPPGMCFGTPPPPQLFRTNVSLPAGDYVVRLLERRVSDLPLPPFDPSAYTVAAEFPLTVRGTPTVVPVPAGGPLAWIALGLGLLALTVTQLRVRREAVHKR